MQLKSFLKTKMKLKKKKAGVPYITYNNNTFITQENLSPENLEEQQEIKEGENDIKPEITVMKPSLWSRNKLRTFRRKYWHRKRNYLQLYESSAAE